VFVPTVVLLTLVQGWLALMIASLPVHNPAVLAAFLAALTVALVTLLVSKLSARIGAVIEDAEGRRLKAEEQRARLEERERATAALARQKEDLTRLVVHDLKNPLMTIVMGVDLMTARVRGDDRFAEIAGHVVAAAQSMDRMTLDILDISRSEDGALLPRPQPMDLHGLVADVVASMRLRTTERHTEVTVTPTGSGPVILGDPQLLQRVVENILDNTLKYAPAGRPIRVDLRDVSGAGVEIRVSDEGPGVPPESRERIFERYARLDRDEGCGARQSRGLGLAFCKLAIEAHGGRIWVEENQPRGSRFCIRLPSKPEARRAVGVQAGEIVPA
jgi:signal transduction histidine kinase